MRRQCCRTFCRDPAVSSRPRCRQCCRNSAVSSRRQNCRRSSRLKPAVLQPPRCSRPRRGARWVRRQCCRTLLPNAAVSSRPHAPACRNPVQPHRPPARHRSLEAHPPRGRPVGRPAAGRRCWSAAVAASGRGQQPATCRRRPGAGTRTGVNGRKKRRPPPGGSPPGRCSGSRRHSRCRPLPCSRRGGRHLQLQKPLSQAARAPPLRRRCRRGRQTAGAASERPARGAPGVLGSSVASNRPGGQACVGRHGAGAVARTARGPWPSQVVRISAAVCPRSGSVLAGRVLAGRPCPRGCADVGRPERGWPSWLAVGAKAHRPLSDRALAGRSCQGIPHEEWPCPRWPSAPQPSARGAAVTTLCVRAQAP